MIYSEPEFIILFIGTAVLLQVLSPNTRQLLLCFASFIFILWAGITTFMLFLVVVVLTWVGMRLAVMDGRLASISISTVFASLVANLLLWKYSGWLLSLFGLPPFGTISEVILQEGLPIGISFYTLQAIGFLVDIRRGKAKPVSFIDVLTFEVLFCQLVAGPIVRSSQLMYQVQAPRRAEPIDILCGIELFGLGLFKKLVLADRAAYHADLVFQDPTDAGPATIFFAVLLYTVQIWADFSGYTDMGRGAARTCGIILPENFKAPYLATSPSDFWRRWHITLSSWIRDYIYIPLGGNRVGLIRNVLIVLFSMSICGFWHGAALTFILWGFYHGLLVASQHVVKKVYPKFKLPRPIACILMFFVVALGWVLFRANSLEDAGVIYQGLSQLTIDGLLYELVNNSRMVFETVFILVVALVIQFLEERAVVVEYYRSHLPSLIRGFSIGSVVCISIAARGTSAPFLYFQF